MKKTKRILSIFLVFAFVLGASLPVFAEDVNTEKEEVVYVNLTDSGSVKEVTVVNSFDPGTDGKITDYGDYKSVRNMTTTDKIDISNGKITINAKKGKLSYEGVPASAEIPWDIKITYYLDGKEISAKDLAGKSGKLEIKIKITKNELCGGNFYDGTALQATVTLDTEKCKNIVSENATTANVGDDKQLSYIILPGKDSEINISADVTDFESDGIAINGVKLGLAFSLDNDELRDKIDEVISAIEKLDDGASDIENGASEFLSATGTLKNNTKKLYDGVGTLYSGANNLSGGLSVLGSKGSDLVAGAYSAFEGLCTASSAAINAQTKDLGLGEVNLTPENYEQTIYSLLEKTDAAAVYEKAYNEAEKQVTAAVEENAETLYAGYINQNADMIIDAYINSQADALYTQVAAAAVKKQLTDAGMTDAQAEAYLQTAEGQVLVMQAKAAMTDEQKAQILAAAKASLTDEQKTQILTAAKDSLTEEQKTAIRTEYIKKQMTSDEVISQINTAVEKVSTAAGELSALKGQLDKYAEFYSGIKEYTSAVSDAATGAESLKNGLEELFANTKVLDSSVGTMNSEMKKLYNGTEELSDGTSEFRSQTDGLYDDMDSEISAAVDEATGKTVETGSFVSEKNTEVKSVQFVMKTDGIKKAEAEKTEEEPAEELNFWQKLLRLFGLY